MMGAVVALAVDALGEAIAYAGEHPETAINLVRTVRAALTDAHTADALAEPARKEQLTAIASGMAAARANAVQEMKRKGSRGK